VANAFNGTVEPRLVLRHAQPTAPAPIVLVGEREYGDGVLHEIDRDLLAWPPPARPPSDREVRDVRGTGLAGLLADLVATREPVLVLTAHAQHRAQVLAGRLGGFAVASWAAFDDDPGLAAPYVHVVALDPPAHAHQGAAVRCAPGDGWTHLAWGEPELGFAQQIHEWTYTLREPLAAVYRALRAAGGAGGEACEAMLRGEGPQPRTACIAGRLVRILTELGLAALDRNGLELRLVEAPGRTPLERSPAWGAYQHRLEDGRTYLTTSTRAAA
jgi:single-stranded-DNA-specific exonuclease